MQKTLVTFTDPHIRMKTPQSRTDTNWLEQCLGQIEAVFALANKHKARAVLCSGDVGDGPAWSDRAIVGLWQILAEYRHIPFYTTVGQHDVRGHRIEEWHDSSLGLLSTLTRNPNKSGALDKYDLSGMVNVLEGGRSVKIDGKVEIYGFGFNQPETIAFLEGKFPFDMDDTKFRIALVHALVGPEDAMGWKGIEHQNLRGCQVASFGDVHCGFDSHEFPSGCVAYSTGSLTRSSLADIGRVPACAVIKINEDNSFELEHHEIPDGDDHVVFFTKEMVQLAREHQDETPVNRVQRVGDSNGFTARQIALVVDRLETDK